MNFEDKSSVLLTQIGARYKEGEEGQWEPHISAEALVEYYLERNRSLEEPEEDSTILRRILVWMGEQLELTRYLIEQNTPQAQAAYAEQMTTLHVQEQAAMLANADRYEASRGPYDDFVTAGDPEDECDDERGDSVY